MFWEGSRSDGLRTTSFPRPSLASFQEFRHGPKGLAPVGDGVFLLFRHFGGRDVISVRDEHRIVAEAARSGFLAGDGAFHDAVKEMLFASDDEGDGGAEPRFPGRFRRRDSQVAGSGGFYLPPGHFGQEPGNVGGRVFLRSAIAGGMHARSSAKDIDFQAGIIGKTIHPGLLIDILSLLQRIGSKGVTCFRNLFGNTGFHRGDQFEPLPQDFLRFPQFSGIAGGKNNLHKYSFQSTPQR